MPNPRLPRGAFARLAFVAAALAMVYVAIGPRMAHAAGRGGASGVSFVATTAPPARNDLLAEASRWVGHSNPTGKQGPWCGWFASFVLERTGRPPLPNGFAISALRYGRRVAKPRPGDLVVMRGHVAFFAAWDSDGAVIALGGNQDNRVTLARFDRRAVIAFVRPA